MEDELNTLGGRLAAARRAACKTQDEVGEAAGGVSGAAVSAWEKGRNQPSPSQLVGVCNLLGISADYLIGREKAGV